MPVAQVTPSGSILSLDVGTVRIGVAIASAIARLPRPLITLNNDEQFLVRLQEIIQVESVTTIVVGLPRSLEGRPTAQTELVENFVTELQQHIALPLFFQDEALTSSKAKTEQKELLIHSQQPIF
jgi:putative Holliday junction resolvase